MNENNHPLADSLSVFLSQGRAPQKRTAAKRLWRHVAERAADPIAMKFIQHVAQQLVAIEDERAEHGSDPRNRKFAKGNQRAQAIVEAVGLGGRADRMSDRIQDISDIRLGVPGLTDKQVGDVAPLVAGKDGGWSMNTQKALNQTNYAKRRAKKDKDGG